jgi:hypothetical protein
MRQTTVVLLIVLAAAIFALWFLNTHERVSSEVYIGFHGEARINGHLAAQILLGELDVAAESRATLTPTQWLPDKADTIFIRLSPSISIGEERTALMNWVSEGGSLILLPAFDAVLDNDAYLANLGFTLTEIDHEDAAEEDAAEAAEDDDDLVTDTEYALQIYSQDYRIAITDDAVGVRVISDGDNIIVARSEWGNGLVTLLSSADYFTNAMLNTKDHARLFADIVAGEFSPGTVWFIYETRFSSLWALIWRAAPYLLLGLAMAFFLWLWIAMPAFGPRVELLEVPRRSIIEHVKAAGIFVWRHDGSDALAGSVAQLLLHDAEVQHPGLGRLSVQRQAEAIARLTGMTPSAVLDVLHGQPGRRHREFTHDMKSAQTIRKAL